MPNLTNIVDITNDLKAPIVKPHNGLFVTDKGDPTHFPQLVATWDDLSGPIEGTIIVSEYIFHYVYQGEEFWLVQVIFMNEQTHEWGLWKTYKLICDGNQYDPSFDHEIVARCRADLGTQHEMRTIWKTIALHGV